MEVILLKDIAGVGRRYEIKNVAEGYASNFLLPKKMAVIATANEIKKIESEKLKTEQERQIQDELLNKNVSSLSGVKIIIKAKADEKGHLFAGIHKEEIIHSIKSDLKIEIPEVLVDLPHPLKEIGSHKIKIGTKNNQIDLEILVEAK